MNKTILTGLCALLVAAGAAQAQSTAFGYQGRLNSATSAATGLYDFSFNLFATSNGGPALTTSNVFFALPVTNGLFTVTLNFGSGPFNGADRWLEIAVRTNGAASFVTLSNRQFLASSPYAIRAASAATATTASTASTANSVAAGAVDGTAMAGNAVDSSKIADGSIAAGDLSSTLLSNTFWRLTGNAGTSPGANFLGTTDNRAVEVKVNNARVLRLEPTAGTPNLIGGSSNNFVAVGIVGATIGGGGSAGSGNSNRISSDLGTIGGGIRNNIQPNAGRSTIGGGEDNTIQAGAEQATIAGGNSGAIQSRVGAIGGGSINLIQSNASHATISGGEGNVIRSGADHAAIGGGFQNSVGTNAPFGMVPGGRDNIAGGAYSLAAGRRAHAAHDGTFVWADSQNASFSSTASNQFLIRALNGAGIGTNNPQDALHVGGPFIRVTGAGGEGAYLGGNGFANDVQLGSVNPTVTEVALFNRATSTYMDLVARRIQADRIDVAGTVKMSGLQLNAPFAPGSVLSSDADGHAAWNNSLRIETSIFTMFSAPNIIAGWGGNLASNGIVGATISGGGREFAFTPDAASPNYVGGHFATVSGGLGNIAGGHAATVAGGAGNRANGAYSFAAGIYANANHQGSFVWSDAQYTNFASTDVNQFLIRAAGGVGINTTRPGSSLEVNGGIRAAGGPPGPFGSLNHGYAFSGNNGDSDSGMFSSADGQIEFYANASERMRIASSGNVGVGTSVPNEKLHVAGKYIRVDGLANEQAYLGGDGIANDVQVGSLNSSVHKVVLWNPAANDTMDLDARDVSVRVLTIRGGADIAEPFPMKEELIESGSVVVIDDEHPGRLKLSTSEYDSRVAGIVSGAGGVNPGIALHQEGVMGGGQNVALTGRVYVKADATRAAIRPGDLLTTSERPGHAMKVADPTRSQGAILGKAMSPLKKGTGLVLVLVTLQ